MKLTIIILTHNNQDVIKGCLDSIKITDEIIIIDDHSTDDTLKIAQPYKPKIISRKLDNFAQQRNFAVQQAKTPWIFFLDVDERITPALSGEIKQTLENPQNSAYQMKRLNYFFGQSMKHGGYWPDWQTRLFKLKDFKKFTGTIHESPHFQGSLGKLKHHLIHFSHKNLAEGLRKSIFWTKKEAQAFIKAGHSPITWWRIIKVMLWEFCYRFFKKKAFLHGYVGFTESLIQAINRYFVYQQIWEMQQQPSLKEKYQQLDKKIT